jgi:hypothetical protein
MARRRHTAKWKSCVRKVGRKGKGNPYAICTAALGRKGTFRKR